MLVLDGTSIDNPSFQTFKHLEHFLFCSVSQSDLTTLDFTTLEFAKMPCLTRVDVVLQDVDQETCARYLHVQGFEPKKKGRWVIARRKLV